MERIIFSDAHGDIDALNATLFDIANLFPLAEKYFLGDAVDKNSKPIECIDVIRKNCSMIIAGNHDIESLKKPPRDHRLMDDNDPRKEQFLKLYSYYSLNPLYREFISILPTQVIIDDLILAHGRPACIGDLPFKKCKSVEEKRIIDGRTLHYIYNPANPEPILYNPSFCANKIVVGHAHYPYLIGLDGKLIGNELPILDIDGKIIGKEIRVEEKHDYKKSEIAVIGVPSISDSRDGNPNPGYVYVNDSVVCFFRVPMNQVKPKNNLECAVKTN